MKTLNTSHTLVSLNELTLKEITVISNDFALETDLPTTKRFGTKPAAIKKCLANQQAYVESYKEFKKAHQAKAEKGVAKVKTHQGKYQLTDMFVLGDTPTKTGTAMSIMAEPLHKYGSMSGEELIPHFVKNYEQKRGNTEVNESFARGYLSGAIRAGHIKLVK